MKNQRFWNSVIIFGCMVFTLFFLGKMVIEHRYGRILVTLSFFLVLWLPRIIRKVFKIFIPDRLETIYLIYVFGAHFLGSIVNFYATVYWFDTLMHFISGILTAFMALYVLYLFHQYDRKSFGYTLFFMFSFSVMMAGCWEFFEFFSDLVSGGNVQHSLETGVFDTMKDMLMGTLGCLLMICLYGYEYSVSRKGVFYYFMKELDGGQDGK